MKTEDGKVKALMKAGQTVGTLVHEMPGENLGYVDGKTGTVEALAAFDVEASNVVTMRWAKDLSTRWFKKVQDFFGGIWSKIKDVFSPLN